MRAVSRAADAEGLPRYLDMSGVRNHASASRTLTTVCWRLESCLNDLLLRPRI
jgi:hypothetical protein